MPTRPRRAYYPRHAGFKQAKVPEELERMIAAAKAKGLTEKEVDSLWLRGPEAIAEMKSRNGLLLAPREENGILMQQHAA